MTMQNRRSNADRSASTRDALIEASRDLFIQSGFNGTSTPDIVAAAGLTRGALYHHFRDKADLFHAVVEREAREVGEAIVAATADSPGPRAAMTAGSHAYLDAMSVPGRTRLLLVDGPAVLGSEIMAAIDGTYALDTLGKGLAAVLREAGVDDVPLVALTDLLSAAFDRAVLAIDSGRDASEYRAALLAIIDRVAGAGES